MKMKHNVSDNWEQIAGSQRMLKSRGKDAIRHVSYNSGYYLGCFQGTGYAGECCSY